MWGIILLPPSLLQVPAWVVPLTKATHRSFQCVSSCSHISGFWWHFVFLSLGLMVPTVTFQVCSSVPCYLP